MRSPVQIEGLIRAQRLGIHAQLVDFSIKGRFLHSSTDEETEILKVECCRSPLGGTRNLLTVHVSHERPAVESDYHVLPVAWSVRKSLDLRSAPYSELRGTVLASDQPVVGPRSGTSEEEDPLPASVRIGTQGPRYSNPSRDGMRSSAFASLESFQGSEIHVASTRGSRSRIRGKIQRSLQFSRTSRDRDRSAENSGRIIARQIENARSRGLVESPVSN